MPIPSLPRTSSRLHWVDLEDSCLGVPRRFGVYLPAGYDEGARRYPVLYLFRGAETEWAGSQDGREGLVSVLDRLIRHGLIGPMIAVLPGFMAPTSRLVGAPVDWSAEEGGAGGCNGRFERHFFEVKTEVERRFRVLAGPRHAAADGFSIGGYAAVLLALRHPGLFGSVGAFDGSFMWRRQIDPRPAGGRWDALWFSKACAPMFRRGRTWDLHKMETHNPVAILESARGEDLRRIRATRFHVRTVGGEEHGNVDRTHHLLAAFDRAGVRNTFRGAALALSRRARHSWKWADIHLQGTLLLHDAVFRGAMSSPTAC